MKHDSRSVGFAITDVGLRKAKCTSKRRSPVNCFMREACELGRGKVVPKAKIYESFLTWCKDTDERRFYSKELFGRELRVASGYTVDAAKPRINGRQMPHYTGITLNSTWQNFGY